MAKKDQGSQFGRKSNVAEDVLARIVRERAEGKGYQAIARDLTKDGVPTAQGAAKWAPNTVRTLLKREGPVAPEDTTRNRLQQIDEALGRTKL